MRNKEKIDNQLKVYCMSNNTRNHYLNLLVTCLYDSVRALVVCDSSITGE